MTRQIDHIVIYVEDLERGITDYDALGFTVVRGGEHPGGVTHNALIVFADGAYFELISFLRPDERSAWWRQAQKAGEGLLDYALLPTDIETDLTAARSRGLAIEGPLAGGRLRPDGVKVEWQTGRATTSDLPFYCFDVTDRLLRVPEGDLRTHANGASGISGVTIAVADLDTSVGHYRALLGEAATEGTAPEVAEIGIRSAIFRLGSAVITLVQPLAGSGAEAGGLSAYLQQHGDCPYSVALLTTLQNIAGPLDIALAHGARLEFFAADGAGLVSTVEPIGQ